MQHISIILANADNSPLTSKCGKADRIADIIRLYTELHAKNGFYMFVPESEYALHIELIFANKADAEKIANEFDGIPKWLGDYNLRPGLFYGKPVSVLWNDEKN